MSNPPNPSDKNKKNDRRNVPFANMLGDVLNIVNEVAGRPIDLGQLGLSGQLRQNESGQPGGEQVFQMLWDCKFCGTKKLLGIDHRHCPNCGAAQDPEMRYFPSEEDKKTITDPKYAYAGVDKLCPFCNQPNSAAAKFCVQCGGDLENAKEAPKQENVMQGSAQDTGVAADLVLNKFNAEQAQIKAATPPPNTMLPKILIGIAVVAVLGIAAFFFLSKSTYAGTYQISQLSWERSITVQQLNAIPQGNWCSVMPGGAYSVRRTSKTDYKSERYQCGSTTQRQDRGDGSFREVQVPKYCTRNVPYQRDYCNYVVNLWQDVNKLTKTGGPADTPIWPAFTPRGSGGAVGDQRGEKFEEYRAIMLGQDSVKGKEFTYTTSNQAEWNRFKVGQIYNLNVNRLEQVQWDTLKLVGQ